MRRLTAKKVRSGLVTAWRLAGWPTRRSPSSVNATMDGVVFRPSEFSMTLGDLPSITATQELVVPRSMPMTLPIFYVLSCQQAGRAHAAPGRSVVQASRLLRTALVRPLIILTRRPGGGSQRHIGGRHMAARRDWRKSAALTSAKPRPESGRLR